MRRALAVALLVGAVAAPASATEVTIIPGVGIGKVRLGMTLRQVKKVLGPPQTVNKRAQLPGKRGYIEYGWKYTTIWVGLVNTKGVLHAVLVGTDFTGEKTADGVGVGVLPETLKRKLPVAACFQTSDGTYRAGSGGYPVIFTYCLFQPNRPLTVFHLYCTVRRRPVCPGYRIGEIVIRERSLTVPYP